MKRIKSFVANANVMFAFFIYLHFVIMRDVKNVKKNMKSRKTSVKNLLNYCTCVEDQGFWQSLYRIGIRNKRLGKNCKKLLEGVIKFL